MSSTLSIRPLPFDPAFEQIPDDEAETTRELVETMHSIIEKTYEDSGHAIRSVHAKSHALIEGEIEILADLPPELAQGAFAKPGVLPVVMRFSTNPGDILDDKVSTPRGLALKIIGVEGARLPGAEDQVTQDFVMQNAVAFTAPTPKAFLANLKLLAKTTDKMPGMKKALSAVLRGTESVIEALGGESGKIKSLGGHPLTNLLGETYNTVVPFLYGPYYAKLSVVPVSPSLTALTDAPVDLDDKPDGLREATNAYFATHGGEWDIRIQLATDSEKMPIEDASKKWPEDESPYVTVARVRVTAQPAWTKARAVAVDDGLAFSPWHGLAAHRPLGGVMRSRKPAYEMSSGFRAQHSGCPMHEPRSQEKLPV
ncbi:catalase family protein [Robbsia sp. Bb-Pol-6]|uniref:Catalase family protein n=1 Tax=Robbsia betulipollinis TaxID=2981849 RepID=A0ABT3ZS39_9BURK|nr:catalase family protein [Robbsia betulipollinis]MCY0388698.1 catalase family protein [Robbsia betulipollinis]